MDKSLKSKTALVTGAALRIGKSIAISLAKEGAHIVVHCNNSRDDAERTAIEVRALGSNCSVVQSNLDDIEKVPALFSAARAAAGGNIDILINNASIFHEGSPLSLTPDEFISNMKIHAIAPLILSQCMAKQNINGDIINLLDTRILECDNEHAAYHLSKRTLFTLTRMLAKELAPLIRVNGIAPGLVLPPAGKDDNYLQERAHSLPMQCHGSVQDVSDAVVYLLKSSFVTGQVVYIDGGRHLRGCSYEP